MKSIRRFFGHPVVRIVIPSVFCYAIAVYSIIEGKMKVTERMKEDFMTDMYGMLFFQMLYTIIPALVWRFRFSESGSFSPDSFVDPLRKFLFFAMMVINVPAFFWTSIEMSWIPFGIFIVHMILVEREKRFRLFFQYGAAFFAATMFEQFGFHRYKFSAVILPIVCQGVLLGVAEWLMRNPDDEEEQAPPPEQKQDGA